MNNLDQGINSFVSSKIKMMAMKDTVKEIPELAKNISSAVSETMKSLGFEVKDNMTVADLYTLGFQAEVISLVLDMIRQSVK